MQKAKKIIKKFDLLIKKVCFYECSVHFFIASLSDQANNYYKTLFLQPWNNGN